MTAAKFVLELTLIFNSRWTRNTDESPKLSSRQIKWKTLGLILTSVMPNIVGLIKMLSSIFRILLQNLKWQGMMKKIWSDYRFIKIVSIRFSFLL